MSVWEPLWEAAKDILFNTLPIVASLNATAAALVAFLQPLIDALVSILYLIAYPVICVISVMQYAIMGIINPIIDFFNALILLVNDVGYVLNIFVGVFPAEWTMLLGFIILINLGLRIYYFVKDIHILGNSI